MSTVSSQTPLWTPSLERKSSSQMQSFLDFLSSKNLHFSQYSTLHQWSIDKPASFWTLLIDFFQLLKEGSTSPAYESDHLLSYGWFPQLHLNFAENLLRKAKEENFKNVTALNFQHESGRHSSLSYEELLHSVQRLQSFLFPVLSQGDVFAAYMPNLPETVVAMLAASSLGAIFTSTSCDFGVQGVLDRFSQTQPKVLIAATRYTYNGKEFSLIDQIKKIQKNLPSLQHIILVDFLSEDPPELWNSCVSYKDIQQSPLPPSLKTPRFPFSSPLYIMYSSGTTGKPKCIVHSVGGVLLQHLKELGLHTDIKEKTVFSFFTTCGWMMWNWMVSSLYFGAEIILYEGSPAYPSPVEFLKKMEKEEIQVMGTSPKFLKTLESFPKVKELPFNNLRTICSTGAPLMPEQFHFVYDSLKRDVHLASISGGTDILGCFALGNPLLPVYQGELQCIGLGMDVAAYNEKGQALIDEEGELVCRKPFPSMPVGFWNDPEKEAFFHAYFDQFPGVWAHGDYCRITPEGTVRIFGRSDATLNPGGVRIGTGEIYRQTEQLDYLEDSLCVGRKTEDDVEVLLFVQMKQGEELSPEREREIKSKIRKNVSPRHVPSHIVSVKGIPYTRSGKKMELLITHILNRRPSSNVEVLANPECLSDYEAYTKTN